jgi:8-oxo-dGTP pyrophosphatase MutT (NUDIX family)
MGQMIEHSFHHAQPGPAEGWQIMDSQRVWDGAHVQVDEVRVVSPHYPWMPRGWTVVKRKPAVAMAAYLADGRWVLIRQERIPVMQELWEFPAGQVDAGHDADAAVMRSRVEQTALTELHEEAGLTLLPQGKIQHLGHVFLSPGFTDEVCYLVLAGPMEFGGASQPQGGEVITQLESFTMEQLRELVNTSQLSNAISLALFAKILALR